jgi:hypothetical protein
MKPAPNIIAMNSLTWCGVKYNTTATHTDKQVTQSKGFNLAPHFILKPFFIACGIPATLTK